jgi:uncharacterized protein YbjT (DUF2867 family)
MQDKVALITGASSGIGRAAAVLFIENGFRVVAAGRNAKALGTLRNAAKGKPGSVKIVLADVSEISQIDRLVAETVDSFGQIDVLVNAAGIIKNGSIVDTTLDDWDKVRARPRANKREYRECLERNRPASVSERSCILRIEGGPRPANALLGARTGGERRSG